jgi:uncharacterized protein YndB with AHSA1/START domain
MKKSSIFLISSALVASAFTATGGKTDDEITHSPQEGSAVSNREKPAQKLDIVLVRTFDAPVEAVWKAWTDAEQVQRWWGPKLYTSPWCKIELREGGKFVFCMRAPKEHGGQDSYTSGVYSKIVPLERLEFTQGLSDKDGNPIDPSQMGMPADFPKEIPTVVTFKRVAGKTTVKVTESGWTPGMMHDFSEAGMSECLDKLAETLPAR